MSNAGNPNPTSFSWVSSAVRATAPGQRPPCVASAASAWVCARERASVGFGRRSGSASSQSPYWFRRAVLPNADPSSGLTVAPTTSLVEELTDDDLNLATSVHGGGWPVGLEGKRVRARLRRWHEDGGIPEGNRSKGSTSPATGSTWFHRVRTLTRGLGLGFHQILGILIRVGSGFGDHRRRL
jgi:hypothetical protein